MTSRIKKILFSKTLFITSSIAALILFGALYFVLLFGLTAEEKDNFKNDIISDKYYLNENYEDIDPYVTKVPNLSDMLAGPIITDSDPGIGSAAPTVTLVEFSDFECDFCRQQEEVLAKIVDKYKNDVKLIWKDYPDRNPESISFRAAAAARCAQKQGMFWQYHDLLYENTSGLSEESLLGMADSINMDKSLFEKCLKEGEVEKLVLENIEEADALDISGIPFIFVNSQEVMGGISFEDLERMVNIEMEK